MHKIVVCARVILNWYIDNISISTLYSKIFLLDLESNTQGFKKIFTPQYFVRNSCMINDGEIQNATLIDLLRSFNIYKHIFGAPSY